MQSKEEIDLIAIAALLAIFLLLDIGLGVALGIRKPTGGPAVTSVVGSPLAGGVRGNVYKVIPVTWAASSGEFMVRFQSGVDAVTAVMDTGSAQFLVATSKCGTCTGPTYDPDNSSTAIALVDPRKLATSNTALPTGPIAPSAASQYASLLCTSTVSYVSQSNTVQTYQDTVTFPRTTISEQTLCSPSRLSQVVTASQPSAPLVVTDFPVSGIVSNTGSSSLNVLGLSGVMTTTTITENGKKQFLLPSCQTADVAVFESPLLQAVALYYKNLGLAAVWSQYLGVESGFIVFGPVQVSCLSVARVPLVDTLPTASDSVAATKYRYYVVAVVKMTITDASGNEQALPNPPAYFILDSGTTTVQIPSGRDGMQFLDMDPGSRATITVGNPDGATADLVYTHDDLHYAQTDGSTSPIMSVMDDGPATAFASAKDVGILGNLGMRNMYIEYTLGSSTNNYTNRTVGFARRSVDSSTDPVSS